MIEIVHMPFERKKFSSVIDSVDLRCQGFGNTEVWIGQSAERNGSLEDFDRDDCIHVLNQDKGDTVGYARLIPVDDHPNDETVSGTISGLARQSNRYPAFELQSVSFYDDASKNIPPAKTILRELIVETMRIANNQQCRFLYTTCDRGGTALLRDIGLRYSTLSAPFPVNDRLMVIVCIAVTNANILALNPFKVVGGRDTQLKRELNREIMASSPAVPSDFARLEAIASLKDQCDDPINPNEV